MRYIYIRIHAATLSFRPLPISPGYTIIELLVGVSISAIIAMYSVPNMNAFLAKTSVRAASMDLSNTLMMARNHAINNQVLVQICASQEENRSLSKEPRYYNSKWSSGWLVFEDVNENNYLDADDHILRSATRSDRPNIIFNQRGRLRFFADGSARSAGFYVCEKSGIAMRHIKLLHTGRTRVSDSLSARQQNICSKA